MNKCIALAVFCLTTLVLQAQDQDTTSKSIELKSSKIGFTGKVYAGILLAGRFTNEPKSLKKFSNESFGGAVTLSNKRKTLALDAWGVKQETDTNRSTLMALWGTVSISKKWKLSAGYQPCAVAVFRPHPVSPNGQIETPTEGLLPGVRTGGKIKYKSGRTEAAFSATVNSADNNNPMLAAMLRVGDFGIGYYLGENTWGSVLKIDGKYLETIGVFTQYKVGNFLVIKTKYIDLYSELGFNAKDGAFETGEWGIRKNFVSSDYIKLPIPFSGYIGGGYQYETSAVLAQLFIHIP